MVDNFRHIDKAVAKIIQLANLAYYRDNAALFNNQAVFEIVDILNAILEPTFSLF